MSALLEHDTVKAKQDRTPAKQHLDLSLAFMVFLAQPRPDTCRGPSRGGSVSITLQN